MKSPLLSRRVDDAGRAYAGSQRQIQSCVNLFPERFTSAVADALRLPDQVREMIRWVSPLERESYTEYHDAEFLQVLGFGHYARQLAGFWPGGGPCWDALARLQGGCILVEAKSHVPEVYGGGCDAQGHSLTKITTALDETKRWLGVGVQADWTGSLYQSANRYAHLYFLREKCSVSAYLLNVYFVADPRTPTTEQQWKAAIHEVSAKMGIKTPVPFSESLFFNASELP